MKTKNYIVEKLISVGKRHRWLKYPMLAIVAIVSFFFTIIEKCIAKPRRAAISFAALVLVASQAYFLFASAEDGLISSGNEGANTSQQIELVDDSQVPELQATIEQYKIILNYNGIMIDNNSSGLEIWNHTVDSTTHTIATTTLTVRNYTFLGWYDAPEGGNQITSVATSDFSNTNGSYTTTVYAHWKRTSYDLRLQAGLSGIEDVTTAVPITEGQPTVYTVSTPASFVRTGYSLTQWLNAGGAIACLPNESITLTNDMSLTAYWKPHQYTIEYYDGTDKAENSTICTYDVPKNLEANPFTKRGYDFTGWQIDGTGTVYNDCAQIENLTDADLGTVKLYATWQLSSAAMSQSSIHTSYGDTLDEAIEVKHTNGDLGDYTVEVLSSYTTVSNGSVADTMNSTELLNAYEIQTQVSGSTVKITSTGVKEVGTLTLKIRITDNENKNESNMPIVVDREFTIQVDKAPLIVTGIEHSEKMYDNTNTIGVGEIYVDGVQFNQALQINSEGQKGTFDNSNAGNNKHLILTGITVAAPYNKYYTLNDTYETTGKIEKRTIYIRIYPDYTKDANEESDSFIYSGETPFFTIEELLQDDKSALQTGDTLETLLGEIGQEHFSTTYFDTYKAKNYDDVSLDIMSTTNYNLTVSKGTLAVKQQSPDENSYEILGQLGNNNWYYGICPTVQPTLDGYYDSIRVVFGDDATPATQYDDSFAASQSISEENCSQYKKITIQLANSTTKAVTSTKEITVYVDENAPEVDVDQVAFSTVNDGALAGIGNFLSFGNFFKESIKATIPIADATSGNKELSYKIKGETKTAAITNGEANIVIPLTYDGQIEYTVSDKAGNVSSVYLLEKDGVNAWVVEETGPETSIKAVHIAQNQQEEIAYDGDYWYRQVTAVVDADDNTEEYAGINRIEWNVNGERDTVDSAILGATEKAKTYKFEKVFNVSGEYTVNGTVYDNAENKKTSADVTFKVDADGPLVEFERDDYNTNWNKSLNVKFSAVDSLSGIKYISILYKNHIISYYAVKEENDLYEFTAERKGTYTVEVGDVAGNITTIPLILDKVSSAMPDQAHVTIIPEEPEGLNSWYVSQPQITITPAGNAEDETNVTTCYRIWRVGSEEPEMVSTGNYEFAIPREGNWNLKVWTVSDSGMESEPELFKIGYDCTPPAIGDISGVTLDSYTLISIPVVENESGIGEVNVTFNGVAEIPTEVVQNKDKTGYIVKFKAAYKGEYSIKIYDLAGNQSDEIMFQPLTMKIQPIMGISHNGATIGAKIQKGTYDIKSTRIEYAKADGSDFMDANAIRVVDEEGNINLTASLQGLEADTRYAYRIYAISEIGESLVYTGYFKTTLMHPQGISIFGQAVDEDGDENTKITVSLMNGDTSLMATTVSNREMFKFDTVADGVYRLVATNGIESTMKAIVIQNGVVVEPTGVIVLTLHNGKSTDLEIIGANTPSISASGLETIFGDSTNFTIDDLNLIADGGNVQFKLRAQLMAAGDISDEDMAAIYASIGKDDCIGALLDFTLWKLRISNYGQVEQTPVTDVVGGKMIRIVIPLSEELASKSNLKMIRIHNGKAEELPDLDTNPSTYTIETNKFSIYALTYTEGMSSGTTDDGIQSIIQTGNTTTDGSLHTSSGVPQTGDVKPIIFSLLGLVSILGICIIKKKK